jgi:heme/copper-type cytochrome/quinol oxidase subunit 2
MRAALAFAGALVASSPLLACPICFQVEQGPVANGVHAAVIVLVAVTVSVLTGFAVFIRRFVRAARAAETEPASTSSV